MTTRPAVIVVGVDGSAQSLRAVDWATREAVAQHRPLRIVHAFLWPLFNVPLGPPSLGPLDGGLQNAAEQILFDAVDRAHQTAPDLDVSTDLPVCSPAAALVEASHDAGLVVVGHRGLGGFTGLLVGSVGVQAAAHAACPVVIVRDGDPDASGPAAGQVVVGVDGSDLSSLAADVAFTHAMQWGLGVVAVHVGSDPSDHGNDLLTEVLSGYRSKYPNVPVQQRVRQGQPAGALVAEAAGAALLVVGSRGRGGFTGLLLGSTSQGVLHHADCPVAIVRAHRARTGPATSRPGSRRSDAPRG